MKHSFDPSSAKRNSAQVLGLPKKEAEAFFRICFNEALRSLRTEQKATDTSEKASFERAWRIFQRERRSRPT